MKHPAIVIYAARLLAVFTLAGVPPGFENPHLFAQTNTQAGLRIVVIAGEDAVNVVQQRTAVAPVVEVRDRNDQPVAGATVTFAIRGGRALFGGARTVTLTTDGVGRAVAAGFTPTASGSVQIGVTATFQGQTALTVIAQTNVMTAAQATAAAGAAAGGGTGGLSPVALAGILGGAGAATAVAVEVSRSDAPAAMSVVPTGSGIRDVTRFAFTAAGGGGNDYTWDFGDGGTAQGASVTHVYNREGSFRATVRTDGESAYTDVAVGSLTGTWIARITSVPNFHTHRVNIVQQGSALTGQWVVEYDFPSSFGGPGNPNVSVVGGSLSDPRGIRLTQSGDCQRIVTGTLNPSLTTLGGPLALANPNCIDTGSLTLTLVRQ